MAPFQLLHQLPRELLLDVLSFLEKPELSCLSQTSRWLYGLATPSVWRNVELVDCRTAHPGEAHELDEHDDTPLIKKLLILWRYVKIIFAFYIIDQQELPVPAAVISNLTSAKRRCKSYTAFTATLPLVCCCYRCLRDRLIWS